jgi:hypothetical protein
MKGLIGLSDVEKLLTLKEIKDRLHRYNLSIPRDWSVFDDVPFAQAVYVMYPDTQEQKEQILNELFGELDDN